jgi:hypothetical protein
MRKILLAVLILVTTCLQNGLAQVPTQEQADGQLNQVYQQLKDTLNDGWPDEAEENLNLSGRCKESKENGYKCYGFRCVIAPIAQK